MRQTRNLKFVPIGRKGASGEIREIKHQHFFIYIFSRTRLLKWPVDGIWRTMTQNSVMT